MTPLDDLFELIKESVPTAKIMRAAGNSLGRDYFEVHVGHTSFACSYDDRGFGINKMVFDRATGWVQTKHQCYYSDLSSALVGFWGMIPDKLIVNKSAASTPRL